MIEYLVSLAPGGGRDVRVTLDADHPDRWAPIVCEGHPADVLMVEELLFASHGIDGRLIGRDTTPVDLDVAMKGRWLREYATRLAGEEILARYVRVPSK